MPIFEMSFAGQTKGKDGSVQSISPSQVLQFIGPTLNVTVSVTPPHQALLAEHGSPIPQPISGPGLIDT